MNALWRSDARFSLCGLNCCLCLMHEGGHCPGCGNGNHLCALQRCARERGGVEYCFLCPDYPCALSPGDSQTDSVSFITARARARDLQRARQIGLQAYLNELAQRARLFEHLLACYNDGRRKSLFMRAANLLSVEELCAAVARLPKPQEACVHERAVQAAHALVQIARARGLDLRRATSSRWEERP